MESFLDRQKEFIFIFGNFMTIELLLHVNESVYTYHWFDLDSYDMQLYCCTPIYTENRKNNICAL